MSSFTQKQLLELTNLVRQSSVSMIEGAITEVQGDRIRFVIAKDDKGKDVLSPWVHTHDHRGGTRKRSFFKKGQNVMAMCPGGDLSRAVVMPHAPNKDFKPPEHANKSGQDEETFQFGDHRERNNGTKTETWHEKPRQNAKVGEATDIDWKVTQNYTAMDKSAGWNYWTKSNKHVVKVGGNSPSEGEGTMTTVMTDAIQHNSTGKVTTKAKDDIEVQTDKSEITTATDKIVKKAAKILLNCS